ncbi:hypothetical protein AcV5_006442 [Taiwanofungus camphoratus]|nr:hypothetical protein AcW2_004882 [Antrodia cinnamomea]KAI0934676.1 hypothetical protein AcV5_006442 [Antrodia cinnamomea]KAI0950037.1 hypothetical protein AcV7_008625 [Antrodia cinnamomea]
MLPRSSFHGKITVLQWLQGQAICYSSLFGCTGLLNKWKWVYHQLSLSQFGIIATEEWAASILGEVYRSSAIPMQIDGYHDPHSYVAQPCWTNIIYFTAYL